MLLSAGNTPPAGELQERGAFQILDFCLFTTTLILTVNPSWGCERSAGGPGLGLGAADQGPLMRIHPPGRIHLP